MEVARKIEIILLSSKQQNLFEFGACFYLNKSFLKFSTKQKSLVGCSYFCNPHRSKLARLNMANAFPENRFTFIQKNSEWQIAIPRSPNEYIISKRKYKHHKKLSLYFLFQESRSDIKSSCNKHFTEVPSVYKHNSIFLGFEDCRLSEFLCERYHPIDV